MGIEATKATSYNCCNTNGTSTQLIFFPKVLGAVLMTLNMFSKIQCTANFTKTLIKMTSSGTESKLAKI